MNYVVPVEHKDSDVPCPECQQARSKEAFPSHALPDAPANGTYYRRVFGEAYCDNQAGDVPPDGRRAGPGPAPGSVRVMDDNPSDAMPPLGSHRQVGREADRVSVPAAGSRRCA